MYKTLIAHRVNLFLFVSGDNSNKLCTFKVGWYHFLLLLAY